MPSSETTEERNLQERMNLTAEVYELKREVLLLKEQIRKEGEQKYAEGLADGYAEGYREALEEASR